jgi:hypothetical protein
MVRAVTFWGGWMSGGFGEVCFLIGVVLGRVARKPMLLISEAWRRLQNHNPLIETIMENPASPKSDPDPPDPASAPAI